ncbi:stage II sporulation protein D [Brevibacillus sp. H7]|jgi:stage II sporulation protein D|uniref:stage II sporulation protein D n=1 Tax=Brevibacillus sp. H7 TaxID=3349138 RepID=UPI0037F75332
MKRYLVILLAAFPILLVMVPAALVTFFSPQGPDVYVETGTSPQAVDPAKQIPVKVYRTEKQVIETIPLEQYIEGVVSAEMPAEFELEALKAQALAARTYIVRRLRESHFADVPEGAHVMDTIKHQAYLDDAQRKQRWGDQYEWKSMRIRQAVQATAGIVLTFNGQPIDATFFSTSNGFTENASDYFESPVPYLKSVASPWDIQSPRFEETARISVGEMEQKLGVRIDRAASGDGSWYQIVERTQGNRVGKIRIGSKEFSGREFRERLGLNSSAFSLELKGGQVVIKTRGYGHGVGMSQWGANGMAKTGKSAEQIVKYFYQGVTLQKFDTVMRG